MFLSTQYGVIPTPKGVGCWKRWKARLEVGDLWEWQLLIGGARRALHLEFRQSFEPGTILDL